MADDERLNEQMDQLLNHPALRMQRSVIAMLWFNLLRDLAFGLGSVLGATVLVYATVQFLRRHPNCRDLIHQPNDHCHFRHVVHYFQLIPEAHHFHDRQS